ncbi:hypothetical protein [Peribacillus butanolivorans]|uniref:hypothetical protein n=1 Tax=Peribacillus butanolivorans TaxID=421767 RepID=UPI0036CCA36F
MPEKVHIIINEAEAIHNGNQTILHMLTNSSIEVPNVCYHPNLDPIETFDTCHVS